MGLSTTTVLTIASMALVASFLDTVGVTAIDPFTLGTTKPVSSNSGAGVMRATGGAAGTKYGTQTLSGSQSLVGWTIRGDVDISGNAQLIDCVIYGRVKATGSSGSPLVENCIIFGDGSNYGANGNPGNDVWFLQSTMTGTGIARFRFNAIKPSTVSYAVNGIGYRNFESYRNEISQVVDGISIMANPASGPSNVKVQGDYIHDLMFVRPDPNHSDWTHNDCLQHHSGTGTLIEGVNFEATMGPLKQGTPPAEYESVVTGQAIGFTCEVAGGVVSGVTVRNAWVSGGARGIIAVAGTNPSSSIGSFQNIRFGRNSKKNAIQMSARYSGNSYSGLVYADNGQTVSVSPGES